MEKLQSNKIWFIIPLIAVVILLVVFWPSGDDDQIIECKGSAQCYTGLVSRIIDGNTIEVDDIRVDLVLVSTPEYGEPGHIEAMTFTRKLCPVGSTVVVDVDDGSIEVALGRKKGLITCENTNLNAELLNSDHAEIDTDYCSISEFAEDSWAKSAGC